jgi:hypothetical protein
MEKVPVIFGRNWLPFSVLIRVVTISRWSHCGLISDCGLYVYESTFIGGVQRVPIADFKKRYGKTAMGSMYCVSRKKAYEIAQSKLGHRYDLLAVFGILFKTGWGRDNQWLCSEYLAECTQLFRSDKTASISPEGCYRLTHDIA